MWRVGRFIANVIIGILRPEGVILDGENESNLDAFSEFPDDYSSDDIVYFKYMRLLYQ